MKPTLDRMVDNIVGALSGEARAFYDKEFTFFNEVTSISGKLKPFIKKTKPEKKVRELRSVHFPYAHHGARRRSTRRWPRLKCPWGFTFRVTPMAKSSTSTRSQGGHCKVMQK